VATERTTLTEAARPVRKNRTIARLWLDAIVRVLRTGRAASVSVVRSVATCGEA